MANTHQLVETVSNAITLHDHVLQEPHGWLVDLVNRVSKEQLICNYTL